MKKTFKVLAIALTAFAIIGISSCDVMVALMAAPTLTVVDARTGNGIANAAVTLTPIITEDGSTNALSATTSYDGSVTFAGDVPYGSYTVSASRAGYVFIPFEATVAGWNTKLGKLFGVTTSKGGDPNAVSIFLTWADNTEDIDAHFTYPSGFDTNMASRSSWSADEAYYTLATSGRTHVYHGAKGTLSDFASLDVDDVSGGGPETITLLGGQTGTVSGGSTISINSGSPFIGSILPNGSYYWMGSGEYYLDAWTSTLDTQDVRVVITQGSSIKGIFSLPSNLSQKTISLFRVQMFYSSDQTAYFMVFMPDMRLVENNTTAIRAFGGIPSDSPFVISGSK